MKLKWLQVGIIGSIIFIMLLQSYVVNAQQISEEIIRQTSEILPTEHCDFYTVEKSFKYSSKTSIGSIDNDAAIKVFRQFNSTNDLVNAENTLYLVLSINGEERKNRLDAWRKKYALKKKAKQNTEAAQLKILCSYARFLHCDYIVNPEQLKSSLPNAYAYYKGLQPKAVEEVIQEEESFEEQGDESKEEATNLHNNKPSSNFGLFLIIAIVNFLLLFGAAYYFYRQLIKAELYIDHKIKHQAENLDNYALDNKLRETDLIDLIQNNAVTEQKLEEILKQLKKENDIQYQKNQHFEKLSTEDKNPKTPIIVETTQWESEKAKDVTVFLLGEYHYKYATLIHNTFQEQYIFDKSRAGSTLYELLISKEESNKGLFRLTSDIYNLKMALSKPKNYIEPVCTIEGNGDISEAKSIYCFPGKIKKDGNQWKIEEKAIIQYEV